MNSNPLSDAALRYADAGLCVHPCATRDKHPVTTNGYKDATAHPAAVAAWWSRHPRANIGLPCAPNGLLVLDVDRHPDPDTGEILDGFATLAKLSGGGVPVTPTADTGGGGVHYFFRAPDWTPEGSAGDGLDIKFNGYVLAAPSIHPSGRQYTWREGLALGEVDPADVPAWLEAKIRQREHRDAPPPRPPVVYVGGTMTPEEVARLALDYVPADLASQRWPWLRVGMACHSVGEALFGDWVRWSAQCPAKFKGEEDCRKTWDSFHADGKVGPGTLIYYARQGESAFWTADWIKKWRAAQQGAGHAAVDASATPAPEETTTGAAAEPVDSIADARPVWSDLVARVRATVAQPAEGESPAEDGEPPANDAPLRPIVADVLRTAGKDHGIIEAGATLHERAPAELAGFVYELREIVKQTDTKAGTLVTALVDASKQEAKRRHDVAKAEAAIRRAQFKPPDPQAQVAGGARRQIVVNNRQLSDLVDETLAALIADNATDPDLFIRNAQLVRVGRTEHDAPIVEPVDLATLRERAARAAEWVKVSPASERQAAATGRAWRTDNAHPPDDVIESVLKMAGLAQSFPPLEGVTQIPTLRADGTVLDRPGYDPATRLFYAPPAGLNVPPVPEAPTAEEVRAAVDLIDQLIRDFPFLDPASKANMFAVLLGPIVRPAIVSSRRRGGCTPLHILAAPQAATGKSLLAEIASWIVLGEAVPTTVPDNDGELRKKITSLLGEGQTVIYFDNLDGVLKSPDLAAVLTASAWKDRLLGRNKTCNYPVRATWIVTGNNVSLGGDLPRRCVWTRLDAKTSRPYKRSGFTIPDLPSYIAEHRGVLLAALLTIARAWFADGRPPASSPVIGKFEEWCRIMGGILAHAGIDGFLGNFDAEYDKGDADGKAWEGFLRTLRGEFGDESFTVANIAARVKESGADGYLRESLPPWCLTDQGELNARSLGRQMTKRENCRLGDDNIRVEAAGEDPHSHRARWVVKSDPTPPCGGLGASDDGNAATQSGSQSGSAAFAAFGFNPSRDERGKSEVYDSTPASDVCSTHAHAHGAQWDQNAANAAEGSQNGSASGVAPAAFRSPNAAGQTVDPDDPFATMERRAPVVPARVYPPQAGGAS
jgi:hypothetical protein